MTPRAPEPPEPSRSTPPAKPVTPVPIAGVGAFVLRYGAVLLVKRGRPPGVGLWAIPGGRLEFGESLRAAAEREIFEETQVRIRAGEPIYCFEAFFDRDGRELVFPTSPEGWNPAMHFVIVDLAAEYLSGEPQAADDAADAGWFTSGAADELQLQPATRRFLNHVGFLKPPH